MPKPVAIPPSGFDELSVEERMEYIQSLSERIVATPDQVPISEWHQEVLEERLKGCDANPEAGESGMSCGFDFAASYANAKTTSAISAGRYSLISAWTTRLR